MKQKTETDIQAVIVAQKRERVAIEEKECKEMARVAYLELEAALPALDEAMKVIIYCGFRLMDSCFYHDQRLFVETYNYRPSQR